MASTRACRRCGRRNGVPTKAVARVDDILAYDTLIEETWLCAYCRAAAQKENEAARKRRSRRARWGQWMIRNDRLLVFP